MIVRLVTRSGKRSVRLGRGIKHVHPSHNSIVTESLYDNRL